MSRTQYGPDLSLTELSKNGVRRFTEITEIATEFTEITTEITEITIEFTEVWFNGVNYTTIYYYKLYFNICLQIL